MKDSYNRTIDYMRISITDRCNLRCVYCMPDGIELLKMEELLTYEQIAAVCQEAVLLGITKFKITGGEPLARKGCADLIAAIKAIPGAKQVTLTTNGVLLKEHLPALKKAGADGINISLDTLDPVLFEQITGFDALAKVLEGLQAALDASIPVKINCVLQKGINDQEWMDVLLLAKDRPVHVRFIELMPIGQNSAHKGVSNKELLEQLQRRYPGIEKDERILGNGPAVYYRIPGWRGSIGLISAIHGRFCESCNRIRMTSTGQIKPCLCYAQSYDIRPAARMEDRNQIRSVLQRAIENKPKKHCFELFEAVTERRKMAQIGG